MNRFLTLTLAALAVGTLVAADFADARRMSGGRSLGAQRSAPAQQAQPQTPPSAAEGRSDIFRATERKSSPLCTSRRASSALAMAADLAAGVLSFQEKPICRMW